MKTQMPPKMSSGSTPTPLQPPAVGGSRFHQPDDTIVRSCIALTSRQTPANCWSYGRAARRRRGRTARRRGPGPRPSVPACRRATARRRRHGPWRSPARRGRRGRRTTPRPCRRRCARSARPRPATARRRSAARTRSWPGRRGRRRRRSARRWRSAPGWRTRAGAASSRASVGPARRTRRRRRRRRRPRCAPAGGTRRRRHRRRPCRAPASRPRGRRWLVPPSRSGSGRRRYLGDLGRPDDPAADGDALAGLERADLDPVDVAVGHQLAPADVARSADVARRILEPEPGHDDLEASRLQLLVGPDDVEGELAAGEVGVGVGVGELVAVLPADRGAGVADADAGVAAERGRR